MFLPKSPELGCFKHTTCYSSKLTDSILSTAPHWALSMGMHCVALISPRSRIIISTRPKTYQHIAASLRTLTSLRQVTSTNTEKEKLFAVNLVYFRLIIVARHIVAITVLLLPGSMFTDELQPWRCSTWLTKLYTQYSQYVWWFGWILAVLCITRTVTLYLHVSM